mgnify:FL=1
MTAIACFLAAAGCGGGEEAFQEYSEEPSEPILTTPLSVEGFTFTGSPPETLSVRWIGEGPGRVSGIVTSAGEQVAADDTIATVVKDIELVLVQRLEMELELASARLMSTPGDTGISIAVDSLAGLLDSLYEYEGEPLLSGLSGTVLEIYMGEGSRLLPGDVAASISVASDVLFHVSPPEGYMIYSWPAGGDSASFIEEYRYHALYSGRLQSLEELFERLAAVERTAVFEEELSSFVVSGSGDTVGVSRVGQGPGGMVIILPDSPLPGSLLTWADRTKGDAVGQ